MTDDVMALRRSPAQRLWAEMAAASGPGVALREEPFATHLALRAVPGSAAHAHIAAALRADLPRGVGEASRGALPGGEPVDVLWVGPDEFLAVLPDMADPYGLAEGISAGLAALASPRGQVVDVSANRTTLVLTGPRAREVLETGIDLDLHPRVFPVGAAVATLLGSVGILLWRTGEAEWRILPRASFARHTAAWLIDAMRA